MLTLQPSDDKTATPATDGKPSPGPLTPPSDPTPPVDASTAKPPDENANYKPKWVPDKYKTGEEFRAGYDQLTQAYTKKTDDLKKEIEAEFFKERPEAPDKYELPKFEDAKVKVDVAELTAHPMISWWREAAFKKGLSQADFQEGVTRYVSAISDSLPNEDEERKKIGENANQRIEAVSLWAGKTFSEEEFAAVNQMASTASGFKALERLMKATKDAGPAPNGHDTDARDRPDDEETIMKLMNTREYSHPSYRNPAVVERVNRFFKQKYAT